MKALFAVGVVLLVLGVLSLFVPIPVKEKHNIKAGPLSVGVETTDRQKVHPGVTALLIGGGVLLIIVGRKGVR